MPMATKVLLVDLNNFARYPTLPIGYMAAALRRAGTQVGVFSPLAVGVGGVTREARPHRFSLLAARLNHHAATSDRAWVRRWRDRLAAGRLSAISIHHDAVVKGFAERLSSERPHAVLISSYLMYRPVCERICALCAARGIPVLIGGPYFSQPEVLASWVGMAGLSGLVAGEVELALPQILDSLLAGGDLSLHPGVVVAGPDGAPRGEIAPPLQDLDRVPFPDYRDFVWSAYPNRIVPIVTGRGCGWGVCTFCSDVTSTAGRSFRSRTPANVLAEIAQHHRSLGASRFVFTDLKLNSDVRMWRALMSGMPQAAPGSQWIGAVHVGPEPDNGLAERDLRAAAAGGCVRLTTGLESGSERVGEAMKKGGRRESLHRFLHSAAGAGISTRCTMVIGYPGEQACDVHESADFLEAHAEVIERVSLNRLQVVTGTPLHSKLATTPARFPGVRIVAHDAAMARVDHHNREVEMPAHRRAVMRLLGIVHQINRKPLMAAARDFEGVM